MSYNFVAVLADGFHT